MTDFEDGKQYTITESTAWLRSACQAKVNEILPMLSTFPFDVIMTNLTTPAEGQDLDEWDIQCDRCGRLTPPDSGDPFFTGETSLVFESTGQVLVITYGLCQECGRKEVGAPL